MGRGRGLPSANPDNVAAGGAKDALRGGGGGSEAGEGQIRVPSNPCSSFSSSSIPLCVRWGSMKNSAFSSAVQTVLLF